MKRIISIVLAMILCFLCAAAGAEDIAALQQQAEAGDAQAMNHLGYLYYTGNGVPKDDALAAYWWYAAADAGNPQAMYNIGYMYKYGYGVEANMGACITWWKRGAEAGNDNALYAMGTLYRSGNGVEKSSSKAQDHYYRAIEADHDPLDALGSSQWTYSDTYDLDALTARANAKNRDAMCTLAYLYYTGDGVQQDSALAAYWWYAAADAGLAIAMYDTAYMFAHGLGAAQNASEAKRWVKKFVETKDTANAAPGTQTARKATATPIPVAVQIDRNDPEGMIKKYGLDELVDLAVMDNHDAAYVLGECYYYGYGVEEDLVSSFEWFLRIAEEGDTEAYIWVGDAYSNGDGVEMDEEKAVYWYRKAHEAGDILGTYSLAWSYMWGEGVQTDYVEGRLLLTQCIEADLTLAMDWMGEAYYNGEFGLPVDWNEALRLWRMGADLGDEQCARYAAALEQQMAQQQNAPVNTVVEPSRIDIDRGRPTEMMRLLGLDNLVEAAVMGDLDAAYILGWCFYYGEGVAQSYEQSFEWFLRVAEEGDPTAYMWAGDAYFYGRGTAQDYEEAAEWYREAAEEGIARAMYMLGLIYRDGLGVKQDDRKADKWFTRAADEGYTDAEAALDGVTDAEQPEATPVPTPAVQPTQLPKATQRPKATRRPTATPAPLANIDIDAGRPEEMMNLLGLDRLVEAAALGDLDAAYILGWCYYYGVGVQQDYAEAFAWFHTLAEDEGDPRAYIFVADAYMNGQGVEQNYEEALRWYKELALEGDPEISNRLGNYYYHGKITQQDYAEALKWYLLAAEGGDDKAMHSAADILAYSMGGVPRDDARAIELYRQAAELGNIHSMNNLGVMYLNGRGVNKDAQQAVYWITKAAEGGNDQAMYNLGQMYEKGVGVKKSASTARSWYEKAAAAGNENAKKKLN